MDDTIFNEKEYVLSGFKVVSNYLEKKFEIPRNEIYACLLESFILRGRGSNLEYVIKIFNLPITIKSDLIKIYRNHKPEISLRKDVQDFLLYLKKNYKLSLITDGWIEVQEMKVKALNLERYFDLILFSQSEGLEYIKPHRKFFEKALEHFNLSSNEAIMIGDNYERDIIGANNMNMQSLLISNFLDFKEQEHILTLLKGNLHENQ